MGIIMKIFVRAKTGAKKAGIQKIDDTHFVVAVCERPTDGRANRVILRLLAKELGIAPSCLTIVKGMTSREKVVEIE